MIIKYVVMNFQQNIYKKNIGKLYCTRTEGEIAEKPLAISNIWSFFRMYVYNIVIIWRLSKAHENEYIYILIFMYSMRTCFEEEIYTFQSNC